MITICRLVDADRLLADYPYDILISLGHKGSEHCNLRAEHNFIDSCRDLTPLAHRDDYEELASTIPTLVKNLIQFARTTKFNLRYHSLLSHCKKGQSRSAAAAIIFLVASGVPENKAIKVVYESRGNKCHPNWYMLSIADQLMSTNILGNCRLGKRTLKTTRRDMKL